MGGIRNGVQALVKQEASQARYVYCLAHKLNLCIKNVTRTCDLVGVVMDFIHNLVQLIRFSPKGLLLFESLRKEVYKPVTLSNLLEYFVPPHGQ